MSLANKDEKKIAERLWGSNKYLVLSKSHRYYLEIRDYLKREYINGKEVQRLICKALSLDEDKKEVINAYQYIWGYFKKMASTTEKNDFLKLIEKYNNNQVVKEDILGYLNDLLSKYPNDYLENSTIFNQNP